MNTATRLQLETEAAAHGARIVYADMRRGSFRIERAGVVRIHAGGAKLAACELAFAVRAALTVGRRAA